MMCQTDVEAVPPPLLAGAGPCGLESDAAVTRWADASFAGPHACSMRMSQHQRANRAAITLLSRDEWSAEHRDGFDLQEQFGANQLGDHQRVGRGLFGVQISVPDLP